MTPADDPPSLCRFADLTLDAARRRVTRQGQPIELKSLDFDLLRFLVESAPNVVDADVLAEKVWGRHFAEPRERGAARDATAAKPRRRREPAPLHRDDSQQGLPAHPGRGDGAGRCRRHAASPLADCGRRPAVLLLAVGFAAAANYWLAGGPTSPSSPSSVAVLPFENRSPEPGDAYFAAGMQEEIVSQLTKLRALSVIPVRPDDGASASLPGGRTQPRRCDSAQRQRVLHGGTRASDTAPTEVATGRSLWSDSYARELGDYFTIQSEIALEVARASSLELSAVERERIERVPTIVPRALDLYLLARARNPYSSREGSMAMAEVEQALALDAQFTEAWVLYAHLRCAAAQFTDYEHLDEHLPLAEHAARQALELDPELGGAYTTLGEILTAKKDWTGAEAAFQKAMNLNVPAGMAGYAMLQLYAGKFSQFARDIFELARAATPQEETIHRFLAFTHAGRGEWARANELYDFGIRRFEDNDATVSRILNQKMHWLVGRKDFAAARAVPIDDPLNLAMLASLDSPEDALAELRGAYAVAATGKPIHGRDIALWAGHFGDAALALEAMRAATDERSNQIVYAWLPQLSSMRRLPEFKMYMRDIGMVDYWREYGWPDFSPTAR